MTVDLVDHLRSKTVLTLLQNSRLDALVQRNLELMGIELGCTNLVEHNIISSSPPIKQRYYPVSPIMQAHIDKELDEMLKLGVLEKSRSAWSSPILLVKKKERTYRFRVDFRKLVLNEIAILYPTFQVP